ncbi:heavy-metal-associated domain-containing protein [Rhodocyclus tenuis]|uniref:Heavy metal transporter n=2 Tax=Rhodocyclus TaxID=1064 RepID=A0A6L5JS62_RHOTE|nr:heavy-metal-associated domain-containing protein [Rhodocyclus gracilis]MQY50287.1 heavy metal transporter [Rhodocyclus gracilis]MRD71816.1 heavy metal transporter [Rhodocyclus gracilis]NJA87790.1 heavy-metal-associated domain-containing protein [Rhodocyclus gracilis]
MEKITLKIDGMICQTCEQNLNGVLRAMAGVERVVVTLNPGQAEIDYDPEIVDLQDFREAVETAGFEVV